MPSIPGGNDDGDRIKHGTSVQGSGLIESDGSGGFELGPATARVVLGVRLARPSARDERLHGPSPSGERGSAPPRQGERFNTFSRAVIVERDSALEPAFRFGEGALCEFQKP